jgi:ferredoxin
VRFLHLTERLAYLRTRTKNTCAVASALRQRYSARDVPTLEFLANSVGRLKRVEAPDGGDLVDICDEYLAPIPFSCRSASCGTCHVEVLEGGELLEPPGAEEAELLGLLGGCGEHRLACQARVKPGSGVVRLRAVLGG